MGLHTYHNYSRVHYGWVTLREALGNSLNIPAVRTLEFVGVEAFLDCLHRLGIESLQRRPDFYGSGLAIGNGEITLYELVQAYGALADRGVYHPLRVILNPDLPEPLLSPAPEGRVFSSETASLIGNILSDPSARRLEFDSDGVLSFPVQTAVKTGTSSDYRDAWAVGYTDRYTAGVWMGNLDRTAMRGISGARGPALVLRALFAELNRHGDTAPLYLSPRLVRADICRDTGLPADRRCAAYSEWFAPGSVPGRKAMPRGLPAAFSLLQPTAGLQLAMDPRIPDGHEAFPFLFTGVPASAKVALYVDRKRVATISGNHYLWPMQRGRHTARARLFTGGNEKGPETPTVRFWVK
jgi:penicillin-binding protein 1C